MPPDSQTVLTKEHATQQNRGFIHLPLLSGLSTSWKHLKKPGPTDKTPEQKSMELCSFLGFTVFLFSLGSYNIPRDSCFLHYISWGAKLFGVGTSYCMYKTTLFFFKCRLIMKQWTTLKKPSSELETENSLDVLWLNVFYGEAWANGSDKLLW